MRRAGFVLVGGKSARMGRDKALLPFQGGPLASSVAKKVAASAGSAALIGDPARYGGLGYPVYPDHQLGCGPIGGLQTALRLALAEWNLILACDMPSVPVQVLNALLGRIDRAAAERTCIVPVTGDGQLQPLCAVYHSSCLPVVERAIAENRFKMISLLGELNPVLLHRFQPEDFLSANTPEQWASLQAQG